MLTYNIDGLMASSVLTVSSDLKALGNGSDGTQVRFAYSISDFDQRKFSLLARSQFDTFSNHFDAFSNHTIYELLR